jgi:hypothetical protein
VGRPLSQQVVVKIGIGHGWFYLDVQTIVRSQIYEKCGKAKYRGYTLLCLLLDYRISVI